MNREAEINKARQEFEAIIEKGYSYIQDAGSPPIIYSPHTEQSLDHARKWYRAYKRRSKAKCINLAYIAIDSLWSVGLRYLWHTDLIYVPLPNYSQYHETEWWQVTRERVLKRDGYHCMLCGDTKNLCVHHNTYERLGNEHLSDLVTLCKACHKTYHRSIKARRK